VRKFRYLLFKRWKIYFPRFKIHNLKICDEIHILKDTT
jgi:hypothetical protein